uniref:Triple QxxK/R motif-containing protein n=1 Tax=Scleropages formosus TaxID=113540 RepID=A0A8C9TMP2_SCLFO
MGKKDATVSRLPVDQYRKEIGKQDYKKTKPALRAARLKAEAKRNAPGIRVRAYILPLVLHPKTNIVHCCKFLSLSRMSESFCRYGCCTEMCLLLQLGAERFSMIPPEMVWNVNLCTCTFRALGFVPIFSTLHIHLCSR